MTFPLKFPKTSVLSLAFVLVLLAGVRPALAT